MHKAIKLLFLFLFVLIISAPSIYSASLTSYTCSTTHFNDSFVGNDTYTNRGYDNIGLNCGNFPLYPVNTSMFDTFSFGHKTADIVCGASHLYNIRHTFDTNITAGSNNFVIVYDLMEITAVDNFMMSVKNGGSTVFTVRNFYDALTDRTSIFNYISGQDCDMTAGSNLAPPYNNTQFVLSVDVDRGTYSAFYINTTTGASESYGCHDLTLGSFTGLSTIEYGITGKASPAGFEAYMDNIIVCEASVLTSGIGNQTEDLSVAVATVWDDMGLHSSESKFILGVGLIFLINVIIVGFSITHGTHINVGALVIINICFMILEVIVGLLPIWIPIVIVLVGASIGALAIKKHAEG